MIVKGAPIYLCRGLCEAEGREEELLVMNSFVKLWSNLYVSVQHSGLEWPPAKRCPSRYDVKTAYFHLYNTATTVTNSCKSAKYRRATK